MAWRFKASKYKNAAPIVPKPEACIRDISVGSYQTYGNNICASAAFMAFNWEHVGSSMAVLPLDDCGRKSKTMPLLHAHSDTITDMEFSPFHDGLLLTGSQDSLVKVWHIPPEGLKESLSTPECTLSQKQRRVENVGFHPVADGLIHVASGHELALWDLTQQKEAFVNRDHGEVIQSTSWKKDGRVLVTSCKDKKVRIVDPRVPSPVLNVANSHQNIKDSRVVWLGTQDRILTTGFDSARLRQIMIRDVRNLSQTQKTMELDCSTGILMPLFDPDTNMLFLAGKGDTTILYMELTDRDPYLIEGLRHSGEQTKGACLVPKRALRVMEGEVNRVLQLAGSSVVPIMYQVPRKSYRDYHSDLYPDTAGCVTYVSAPMWLANTDHPLPTISLNPQHNNCHQVHRGNLQEVVKKILEMPVPKPVDNKKVTTPTLKDEIKTVTKVIPSLETKEEDRIDFVNVKDLIKGMEKQKTKEHNIDSKETNGFHKKITDNFQENGHEKRIYVVENAVIINSHETPFKIEKNPSPLSPKKLFEKSKTLFKVEENLSPPCPKKSLEKSETSFKTEKNPSPISPVKSLEKSESSSKIGNNPSPLSPKKSFEKSESSYRVEMNPSPMSPKKSFEKSESTESKESVLSRSNSYVNGGAVQAPKPLPRSSISEGGSMEDQLTEAPKPKPRTTTAPVCGYKPRLGPKPFSASQGSEEFSFDKVFSVPAVPGLVKSDSATSPVSAPAGTPVTSTPIRKYSDDKDKSLSPTSDLENAPKATSPVSAPAGTPVTSTPIRKYSDDKDTSLSPTNDLENAPKEEYTNGKSDTSLEEEVHSSDSGYVSKTPSTADRRKMFETTDGSGQSIADRRRAYELRSMSVAVESDTPPSPAPLRRRDSLRARKSPDREDKRASVPNVTTKRTSTVFGKVSKFRHLKGTPGHKSTHVENIKNISRQISGECNGFYANGVRCAVPISGGGGRVAIIELPVGATPIAVAPPPHPAGLHPPALLHPAPLTDWAFDPFRTDRLMVACDDGIVREWIIPVIGLQESTNSPLRSWSAHPDKIYTIRFHPTASDLLTTAAHDLTIKIWDLSTDEPTAAITLTGHTEQIFAMDWSSCGQYLATVCKDGQIRIYEPRASCEPILSGVGPAGSRGARVVWALRDSHLVVTGFDKVSERQILLYNASDLSAPVCTVGLDVSPAILQVHYDQDSATLFLTGRGDSTIYCYEVTSESPYLCALSHHRSATLHQGIAFLHKNLCAVDKVEFARALRLTNGTIEPLSFTVPRIKSELFQDDLFPPTLVTWQPWQSGRQWLSGSPQAPKLVSLQPEGMEPLSAHVAASSPVSATKDRAAPTHKPDIIKSHVQTHAFAHVDPKEKQESIMKAMSAKMSVNLKLEQDNMEGVDETEWEQ